jgi:peptidoglycan-associated lipoprotein
VNNADVARPFNSIYFAYDSYALSTEARTSLVAIAESLKRQKSVKVRIEGNCDERGADEYNLALGERRAKAAAGYLTLLGVDEARLAIISYGKEKPAVTGHDEASWAKNRRDDIVIVQ